MGVEAPLGVTDKVGLLGLERERDGKGVLFPKLTLLVFPIKVESGDEEPDTSFCGPGWLKDNLAPLLAIPPWLYPESGLSLLLLRLEPLSLESLQCLSRSAELQ